MVERSKLGESSCRRATFAAAMQQFEEQFTAAASVAAATRPVNLYYGPQQAGLAITAALASGELGFHSHGLAIGDTRLDLAEISVHPSGSGAFQAVAAAIGSKQISGPVSIMVARIRQDSFFVHHLGSSPGSQRAGVHVKDCQNMPSVNCFAIKHPRRAQRPPSP